MPDTSASPKLQNVNIPLQDASFDIWNSKYRLKDNQGVAVDKDVAAGFVRVAKALASVELTPALQKKWASEFIWALENGAIPAGRILSNAGALNYKPATSTINCTVSGTINDSMDSILDRVKEAGLTLKAGCGIGYEFSTLRPKDAYVNGAGAYTSGPLSFMDVYDKMCFTVSSAGGRRGAQMATFDVSHPDIFDFIKAKREDGRLRQFNLSLLITNEFIDAVKNNDDWPLVFPITEADIKREKLQKDNPEQVQWRYWHVEDGYAKNAQGRTAFKVYRMVRAAKLWNAIMASNYDFAEPGFILIDRVNDDNNNWFCETIRATNPCGEQPLPPYGSCLLGSINLTKFVDGPFTDASTFNWKRFRKVVNIFTRLLDNVVEINGLPLSQQRDEILTKRRHGMGFLGLGSSLAMLGFKYGDAASVAFTEEVAKQLALEGWRQSLALAKEKGPAPALEKEYEITEKLMTLRPEMLKDGIKVGDKILGKVLHAKYSRHMQQIGIEDSKLVDELAKVGSRFTHHSSIAPTGTISLSIANNASNGIEPSFAHKYSRNIIKPGKKSKEKVDVLSYEFLAYLHMHPEKNRDAIPTEFSTSDDVSPSQHVAIQAAAQKWIDSSISKTANIPSDYPYNDFKDIYMEAHEQGLKGCTTFRFNPEAFQGVLVKNDDLKNTTYEFTLLSGKTIQVKGDEEIEYDGETHTAANLFDALKEGYYGKL